MRGLKSFFIAVSMYSKIPVPQFAWKEEDMRYIFCFFPWVGGVVGACVYLWHLLSGMLEVGQLGRVLILAAVPLLLTGGIHIDGFMDTMDALHSYQPREKKLEILKDSHIGAFAVIMLAAYGMVFLAALSEVRSLPNVRVVCAGFFLARCLSGISAVSFPLAKKEGMLFAFADSSQKRIVKAALYLQALLCIGCMLFWSPRAGGLAAAVALLVFVFYYFHSKKVFGGVTGDTAGYFLCICEAGMIGAAAVCNILGW